MLLLKYLLVIAGLGMFAVAAAIVATNLNLIFQHRRRLSEPLKEGESRSPEPPPTSWKDARKWGSVAWVPLLLGMSIVVVPSGKGGVRVSQISGTRPGTLYPGIHFVKPLLEHVVLYDIRDQVLTTSSSRDGKTDISQEQRGKKPEVFMVQAREGLPLGLAITVRYRLDAKRLDFIQTNLPQPVEEEIVPPVIASVFRELVPNYTVREVFATHREELRRNATSQITARLAADGIIVKEVMLRDIQLPPEYARGLEGLILKEQENESLTTETEMRQKQVRIAELEAEAAKVREVKHAEGDAQVRVLQAKSEADSMTYTLPLKEKQIQQTRLEAEARKESTLKNAEAQAQAKVIDSKAEVQRRDLLAESEAKRIRLVASADKERMQSEAVLLKQNPLLINKIIAERLSDKLQIMMVPSDGKFFFNDVLKGSGNSQQMMAQAEDGAEGDDPPEDAKAQTARPLAQRRAGGRK